jgi:hypothetical protein
VYDGTTWNIYPLIGVANQVSTIDDISSNTLYPIMVSGVGTGYTARITPSQLVFNASNGNLGIGSTIPTSKLDLSGDAIISGNLNVSNDAIISGNLNVSNDAIISGNLNVSNDAIISGIITCTDLNSSSDANLKTNVQKLNNSIEILKQINPVSFNWKDNGKKSYGIIAQELEKILPELIGEMNGYKTISYTPLMALLIDAILELDKRIEN